MDAELPAVDVAVSHLFPLDYSYPAHLHIHTLLVLLHLSRIPHCQACLIDE